MKEPILIHSEEDYECAQQRLAEIEANPDTEEPGERQALTDAMLAWEIRIETTEEE